MYTIYKIGKDGVKVAVGFCDDPCEAAMIIEAEMKKHEDDMTYEVVRDRERV